MPGPSGVPLVDVSRGGWVESVHAVAGCAVTAGGETLLECGDVDVPVFMRSTAKPFIAAAVVATGAAARFALEPRELAVMAASHSGEPFHLEAVRAILRKAGLEPSALQCGAPDPARSALDNNCSGKHAGILAACVHLGLDPDGYLAADHPVQRRISAFCARAFDDDAERWPVGVDGCGIPIFATSLRRAAKAFARVAALEPESCGISADPIGDPSDAGALLTVREAMRAEPLYVGGTGRFDSALMSATRGGIACKGGAEGVHGDALLRAGAGLALKVVDGNARAVAPATLAFLSALGMLEAGEAEALAAFARPEVRNVAGRVVGRISARAV